MEDTDATENPNDRETASMRSINDDLEQVEQQLVVTTPTSGGRIVFDSIRSALGNIRSRLQSLQLPSETVNGRLWDRLQQAEISNSNRIPLNQLRRRQSIEGSSKEGSQRRDSPDRPAVRRQSSILSSRRRADEIRNGDLDLHGSTSILQATLHSLEEGTEVTYEHFLKSEDNDIRPPILLTKRSRSNLEMSQESVLFPEEKQLRLLSPERRDDEKAPAISGTTLYSWGIGPNSLHDSIQEVDMEHAQVDKNSRIGRLDIVSCSIGNHHTACVTTEGRVLINGENHFGEVDPAREEESLIVKPSALESLVQASVIEVSCGFKHTAALRSNGTVLTWGDNEYGQLGHRGSNSKISFCPPSMMPLGAGRRATAVACGDSFTLCLSSRMEVLACGHEEIVTFGDPDTRRLAAPVPGLSNLPIVSIAAGRRHAIALSTHGSAFAWGDNSSSNCGQPIPKSLSVPVHVRPPVDQNSQTTAQSLPPPLTNWVRRELPAERKIKVALADEVAFVHATCGHDHTVLVTRSGKLVVFGSNSNSQLGFDANKYETVDVGMLVTHPGIHERKFVSAEAGFAHTIALDDLGDVWQMGGSDGLAGPTRTIAGKFVRSVAAGGEQSIAIASRIRKTSMSREFSDAVINEELFADCVEQLIDELPSNEEARGSVGDPVETKITSRIEELLRTPTVLNSLFMDPDELSDLFKKLLSVKRVEFQQQIVASIEKGMHKGIDLIRSEESRLVWPEQVRVLLMYIQCPLFVNSKMIDGIIFDRRGDLILALCDTILSIQYEGFTAMMGWATSVYSRDLFAPLLVKPLLGQLEKGLSVEAGAERRPIPYVVSLLRWFYNASDRTGNVATSEDFYSDAMDRMNAEFLFNDLHRFKHASDSERKAQFFFCAYPFLMSPSTKRNLLRIENEVNMMKVASEDVTYNQEENQLEVRPFFVLEIEREHLLQQTLRKVGQTSPNELRKKLRVVFKGEEGVDAGGVTREFFQLLTSQLFDLYSGMWSEVQDGAITWFNSNCFWRDEEFYLSGVLVGIAVYNGVLLDVNFAPAIFRKLLGLSLGLEDMFDEDVKKGLQHLLDYEGGDVEDVFCLNFSVEWMELGEEKTKELKPGGSDIPVTSDNKEEYVMRYVQWVLVDSIYAQYGSFQAGFMRVMQETSLDLLRPEELELLVVGSRELDFEALQDGASYEGGFSVDSACIKNFWQFVKTAPKASQLDFLKFATGSNRAPIGGLAKMHLKIQRAGPDSDHLPTAHTCFNTLLLPDYGDNDAKLRNLLGRAILECEGFGLQ